MGRLGLRPAAWDTAATGAGHWGLVGLRSGLSGFQEATPQAFSGEGGRLSMQSTELLCQAHAAIA